MSPEPAMSRLTFCALPLAALTPPEPAIASLSVWTSSVPTSKPPEPATRAVEPVALDLVDPDVAGPGDLRAAELRDGHREIDLAAEAHATAEPARSAAGDE